MRLCIISQYFLPDINGDVIRLLNSIKFLINEGFDIILITSYPHYPTGEIPNEYKFKLISVDVWRSIKIIRVPILPFPHRTSFERFLIYLSFSFFSLFSIPFIGQIDVVWAFSQRIFSFFPSYVLKIVKKAEVISDVTDVWPEALLNTGKLNSDGILFHIIHKIMRITLHLSDCITTLTKPMKNMLIKSAKISPSKIFILPNAVDVSLFHPTKTIHNAEFNNKFIVMYSGNLGPNYDFHTVLESALYLNDKDTNVLFIIRGYGEMSTYIIDFITSNKLNNIIFDTKILNKKDLVRYLNQADTFLLPLKKCKFPDASFSIKLLDYLSCGKPIITNAEGYLSTLIINNKVGFSVTPNDAIEFSNAILMLKNDQKRRQEFSKNARDLAVNFYSHKNVEKTYGYFFRKSVKS
ncbi:MAG: glycosyltransferase family 4 protein [Candidatus Hodarchaeota archaeon]